MHHQIDGTPACARSRASAKLDAARARRRCL